MKATKNKEFADIDKILVAGPKGLREKMNESISFMGYWKKSMVILEIPEDLHSPPEKSQWMKEQEIRGFPDSMPFIKKYNRVAF